MSLDRLIPASEAARLLGMPKRAKTFMRRAQEAYARGNDARVQLVGRMWCAPEEFWREVTLRPAGRPPKYRSSRSRRRAYDYDDVRESPWSAQPHPGNRWQ